MFELEAIGVFCGKYLRGLNVLLLENIHKKS
jgi:hypothetical protein